jgi:hypothetical protein
MLAPEGQATTIDHRVPPAGGGVNADSETREAPRELRLRASNRTPCQADRALSGGEIHIHWSLAILRIPSRLRAPCRNDAAYILLKPRLL